MNESSRGPSAASAEIDPRFARLRLGHRVWVNGRAATFLHPHVDAAVIRYEGEDQGRVVSWRKVSLIAPAGLAAD